MDYEERLNQAKGIHAAGLQRVKDTPEPKGQKYKNGVIVRIKDDLGESMSHFKSGVFAVVEHTYAHAFGGGGQNEQQYSLLVRYKPGEWISTAWYYDFQLEPVSDPNIWCELIVELIEHTHTE